MKPSDSQRWQHYVTLNHFLCYWFILCHSPVLIIYLLWAPCIRLGLSLISLQKHLLLFPCLSAVTCPSILRSSRNQVSAFLSNPFLISLDFVLPSSVLICWCILRLCSTKQREAVLPVSIYTSVACPLCWWGKKKPCSTQEAVMCGVVCFHPCGKQTNTKRKRNDPGPKVLKEKSHLFLLHAWKVTCTFSHVQVTADTLLHLLYKM